MSCGCKIRKEMSELKRVSELARKAAMLDECIYVIYLKADGSYSFDRLGTEIKGTIVEYRHYL